MAIERVGIVGCGLMGSGIAQVCAAAGFPTVVREVSPELVDKGLKGIEKNLARLVEKGTISDSAKSEIRGRLTGTTVIEDHGNVSRLTGRITPYTGQVDERGRRIESTPQDMATGICVAGPRKF